MYTWYMFLLQLKRWHRYALTLMSSILLLFVWLFMLYVPMHRRIVAMNIQIHNGKQSLDTCVAEQKACKDLSEHINALHHEYLENNGHDVSMQQDMTKIIMLSEHHALQLMSIKKETTKYKDWYSSTSIVLHMAGSIANIYDFFDSLYKDQWLVQCYDITIEHTKDTQYALYATLKFFMPHTYLVKQSPSTLEKAEGLGG